MKMTTRLLTLIFLSFFISVSCIKKPELTEDNGPAVDPDLISNALVEAWGSVNIRDIKQGEYAYTTQKVSLADLPPQTLKQDGKTVQSIVEDAQGITINVFEETIEIDGQGNRKPSSDWLKLEFKKSSAEPQKQTLSPMKVSLPFSMQKVANLMCYCYPKGCSGDDENWNPTCHNFKTWKENVPAPELVAKRPNCENLKDCRMNKNVVSFDFIISIKEGEQVIKEKQKYTIKISPDAPFFSRVTDYCREGITNIQNRRYPYKICESVEDFRFEGSVNNSTP